MVTHSMRVRNGRPSGPDRAVCKAKQVYNVLLGVGRANKIPESSRLTSN
jgi:hypothetical protein